MAYTQVWDNVQHVFLGNVVYAHHYVYADFAKVQKDLSTAFAYQVDLRVSSVDIAHARVDPLRNGPLGTESIGNYGSVSGEVDDWGASTSLGKDCTSDWSQAASVHFLVASKGDITAALKDLIGLAPGVGPIISGIGTFVGTKVRLTIAHDSIVIPIVRQAGQVVAINNVHVPNELPPAAV